MNKMDVFIVGFFLAYLIYLFIEDYQVRSYRRTFKHVIHVNGTRGKSSTSRLIAAALRAGGYRVFCKTTGTSPMTIDVDGVEEVISRRGRANIREQIKVMKEAHRQGADLLVIECMAVEPELQYICQNRILRADISVVTNVRRDHLEVMGPTLKDVAKSLGKVMPKDGYFITADERFLDYYRQLGAEHNSRVILARAREDYGIDFRDNVAIALELASLLGIEEESAIEAIRKNYKRDPGVLAQYRLMVKEDIKIDFINGFAINDPDSIKLIYKMFKERGALDNRELILLVNNRKDRLHRFTQHIKLVGEINPHQVWIIGDNRRMMKGRLFKSGYSLERIRILGKDLLSHIDGLSKDAVIFAIGNMGNNGLDLIKRIEEVGEKLA